MAVVDLLILAALVVGVTLGVLRGFVPQVTGFFGLGGGLYLASRYHAVVRETLLDPRSEWAYNGEASFIGIIVLCVLLAAGIGWALRKLLESTGLSTYDRIMGGRWGPRNRPPPRAPCCWPSSTSPRTAAGWSGPSARASRRPRSGRRWTRWRRPCRDSVGDRVEHFLDDHALPERPNPAPARPPEDIGLDDEIIHYFDEPVPEEDLPVPDTPLSVDE